MSLVIKPVTTDLIGDVDRLFSTNSSANDCWCMWFIIPVKEFHAVGREGNRASFHKLVATSATPIGLLAYQQREPVGWCAVGPRSRYVRALKTPTYKSEAAHDMHDVWLVPCFFVRDDVRGIGVSRALLDAAVTLAAKNGAAAIEGFPFAGSKRRSSGDTQVGTEALFSACGFTIIRTPSTSRVVMRREL